MDLSAAREAQREAAWEANEERCREMERLNPKAVSLDTYPEPYDEWDNDLRYFAVFAIYLDECKREGFLNAGKGPYYCGKCEEKQKGWTRMICWECAWPAFLREKAIEMARRWDETRPGYVYSGPPLYTDLVKTTVPA